MLLLLLRLLLILILILILLVLLLVLLLLLFLLHATAEGAGIVFLRFSAAKNSKKTIPARNCTHLTLSPNCQRELPPGLAAGGDQDEPDDSDEADEVELAEELALALLGKDLLHLLPSKS